MNLINSKQKVYRDGSVNREVRASTTYQIRLGIENRAQELDYEILRYFNDQPFTLSEKKSLEILCIGKFSQAQIASFEEISKPLVFLDSDTIMGHTCVITDFNNTVRRVVEITYRPVKKIGILSGLETTTDQEVKTSV